MTIEI